MLQLFLFLIIIQKIYSDLSVNIYMDIINTELANINIWRLFYCWITLLYSIYFKYFIILNFNLNFNICNIKIIIQKYNVTTYMAVSVTSCSQSILYNC